MATNQPKDILSRVADLGEEALHKLPSFPGADRLTEVVNQSRMRLDETQKKLRGLDVLEQRVAELEKRIAKLENPATPKTASKPAAAKKPTTRKEPPA
jgi:uncharacterized protein involved in exopolysaccharide biosynthesis